MQKARSMRRLGPTNLSQERAFTSCNSRISQTIGQACNVFISQTKSSPPPAQPSKSEAAPSDNNSQHQLGGLKVAIKDIFCSYQTLTTCASKTLKDFISPYDSQVVSTLRQHGAQIIGKTNMDEFSMGSSSTNSYFGDVLNPHGYDKEKSQMVDYFSAGGSSGGSAAAVSAGECDIAIGSDTGGSIRLPAAYCGVVGLKPSYGLISRFGMVNYSHSLDTVGILSIKTDLIRKTFSCLEAYDSKDPTSIPPKTRLKSQQLNDLWLKRRAGKDPEDLFELQVGVPIEYFTSDLSDQVIRGFKAAVDFLKQRGAQFSSISLPTTETCLGAYYVIASAEASSNLARYSGLHYGHRSAFDYLSSAGSPSSTDTLDQQLYASTRSDAFSKLVKQRLLLGSYALSASGMKNYFIQAQKVRQEVQEEFDECFELPNVLKSKQKDDDIDKGSKRKRRGVDVIMTPATMDKAPRLTDLSDDDDEGWKQDRLLVPASLAGLPAIVIPIKDKKDKQHSANVTSTGIQFISQWGTEPILFTVGSALEPINLKS